MWVNSKAQTRQTIMLTNTVLTISLLFTILIGNDGFTIVEQPIPEISTHSNSQSENQTKRRLLSETNVADSDKIVRVQVGRFDDLIDLDSRDISNENSKVIENVTDLRHSNVDVGVMGNKSVISPARAYGRGRGRGRVCFRVCVRGRCMVRCRSW
ncbi:hypothetical protein D915_009891 [Fasciola hepatica]|uniref:Uncharacterized protein n=1 Tax=Fasciola hepatica TaxID=6192 RepID=A0A4E0QUY2_FASHE|nr:hypothetical protein D915_009891 [Fasciola hepatica]